MLKNVLIVDDQQLVRAGMKAMLRIAEPACEVAEAGSYDETLALLASGTYDVVFLDIDLRSGPNGMDVLAYIREAGIAVHVIMLAASDDPEIVLGCIAAGASGYIAKSVGDESVFARALATVFSNGVYLPSSVVGNGSHTAVVTRHAAPEVTPDLPPRLREVLFYVCQGLPNKAIANRMGISEGTVRKNYVSELLRVFKVARRTALVVEVSRRGIRVPPPH